MSSQRFWNVKLNSRLQFACDVVGIMHCATAVEHHIRPQTSLSPTGVPTQRIWFISDLSWSAVGGESRSFTESNAEHKCRPSVADAQLLLDWPPPCEHTTSSLPTSKAAFRRGMTRVNVLEPAQTESWTWPASTRSYHCLCPTSRTQHGRLLCSSFQHYLPLYYTSRVKYQQVHKHISFILIQSLHAWPQQVDECESPETTEECCFNVHRVNFWSFLYLSITVVTRDTWVTWDIFTNFTIWVTFKVHTHPVETNQCPWPMSFASSNTSFRILQIAFSEPARVSLNVLPLWRPFSLHAGLSCVLPMHLQ